MKTMLLTGGSGRIGRCLLHGLRDDYRLVLFNRSAVDDLGPNESLVRGDTTDHHGVINEAKATEVLKRVGLDHRLDHIPSHLSGGEQQRVCIARALINEPKILLADEPTGNLDQKNGDIVLNLFRQLHKEGHTIILVTHNSDIAKPGQRIITVIDGKICSDSECTYEINEK